MFYSPYTLVPCGALSARSAAQPRNGVLLRNDEGGYGCLQTWPELGDPTLDEELDAIRDGTPLRLGARALKCAMLDGEARAKKVNMFDGYTVPLSHATLPVSTTPFMVHTLHQRGFRTGKLKLLPNLPATIEKLMNLAAMVPEWKWRLDFNATLTPEGSLEFWDMLPEAMRKRIDFIEDPCPYTVESWQMLQDAGIPLGYDIGSPDATCGVPCCTNKPMIRVVKPARDRTTEGVPVFTSYMDHPLGQLWAAWCAARYYHGKDPKDVPLCGLVTHHVYRMNDFSEVLGAAIYPSIKLPGGTGLGFDELLAAQEWKTL